MLEVVLSVVGLAGGGVVGYLVSRYFYDKSKAFEEAVHFAVSSFEDIYFAAKYPTLFRSPTAHVRDYAGERPADLDVPHLREVRSETNVVAQGGMLFILFRVIDEGMNLYLAAGVRARNNLDQYEIPVIQEGFGWMSATVPIPVNAPPGTHRLAFVFKDAAGKANTQEYSYVVIGNN
jgi:hypothetical protein